MGKSKVTGRSLKALWL